MSLNPNICSDDFRHTDLVVYFLNRVIYEINILNYDCHKFTLCNAFILHCH